MVTCDYLWDHKLLYIGGFRFVIGVPPVVIPFERWDFPVHKNQRAWGSPMAMETFIYYTDWICLLVIMASWRLHHIVR